MTMHNTPPPTLAERPVVRSAQFFGAAAASLLVVGLIDLIALGLATGSCWGDGSLFVGPVDMCVIYRAGPIVAWAWEALAALLTLPALVWVTRLFIQALFSWKTYALILATIAILVIVALKVLQPADPDAPPPHFPAIARIDLTYTPPYGGGQKITITRHITDAATIHRFTTAFEHLPGGTGACGGWPRICTTGYEIMCSLNEGEDATLSFVPVPVPVHHDWWSRLTGVGVGVHTQTFHVIYGCGSIWTGPLLRGDLPHEYLDTEGIDTMARQSATSE